MNHEEIKIIYTLALDTAIANEGELSINERMVLARVAALCPGYSEYNTGWGCHTMVFLSSMAESKPKTKVV